MQANDYEQYLLPGEPSEDDEARGLLEREIWAELTDGAPWPWGAS